MNNEKDKNVSTVEKSDETKTVKKAKKASKISALFKSRKFKHGWMSVLLSVIFIAVIIGINIICSILTNRFSVLSQDFTSNGVYELTDASVEYLSKLDKDIDIYVLTTEQTLESQGEYYVQANKLLHEFDRQSDKVSLEYIDLAKNPTFTAKFPDIDWQQTDSSYLMIVQCGNEYRGVKPDDVFEFDQETLMYSGQFVVTSQKVEQGVITAILNVTTEEKIGVTVLSGNGEQDSSAFTQLLENNAYSVEEVSLLNSKISDKSQFLLIYAPTQDLDKTSYDTITDWLYNGGKYGHTLIYVPNDQAQTESMPYFDALLEEWGMSVSKSYAFETDSQHMTNTLNPYLISIYDYNEQNFSSKLREPDIPVVMMYTLPIDITDNSTAVSLLTTSDKAVRMPLDADKEWDYNNEEQEKLTGAAISTKSDSNEKNSSNVIVIGSFSAMTEDALSTTSFNNAAYFINLLNTIADRDEIGITIEGKNLDSGELNITSSLTTKMLGALFMYILPLFVVLIGIIIYIRRRHK